MPITLTPISLGTTDLVDATRAAQNDTLAALNSSNPTALASLISAASQQIERYCKRKLTLAAYTEVYSGSGMPYMDIQLANFPVVEITRIGTSPQAVMKITNTSTANQRATVSTTATGLRLVHVASAVSTTTDLLFASYTTLAALATAIGAVAHGWTATVMTGFTLYPSADLLPLQGAASALNSAGGITLELYTEDSPAWGASGIWTSPYGYVGDGAGWRLDADVGYLAGCWPQGRLNIRIDYRAGFDPIPEDVQEACVQHVQYLYQSGLVNSAVKSASIGPFSYTTADDRAKFSTKAVRDLLGPYVDHAKLVTRRGPESL